MILYILVCVLIGIVEVEMSTPNSQAATISRNFGQKLSMTREYSKLLKREDESQCGFNKMPTSSVVNNGQEFITLQPVSTSESSYRPPTPAPYSPPKQQPLPFMSSFFGPIGNSKIKHIVTNPWSLFGHVDFCKHHGPRILRHQHRGRWSFHQSHLS